MVKRFRARSFFLAIVIGVLSVQAAMATTTARVGRNTVSVSDSFQITFETDQSIDQEPDFSALSSDFDVMSKSKSTSINIQNGSMQRASRWILDLMPKREGRLVIPAIVIGDESSNPVNMIVEGQSRSANNPVSGEIDLEVDIDNLEPYVQGQIIFTVRLVHAVSISEGNLSEPAVTTGDALIQKLGDDVSYETRRGPDRVGIIERRYAIFPQNSDKLVIGPVRFEGRIATSSQFGFDPFARGRIVRKQTDPVELNVKPVPADFSGATWLPAKRLLLVDNSPGISGEYRVGEPFTRVLTLQATGLSSSQLPKIEIPVPDTVKAYPDQPVLENRNGDDGMVGSRQEKIALIPSQTGTIILPAIEIPWWNTDTQQMEIAKLPTKTIEVLPAVGGTAKRPAQETQAAEQPSPELAAAKIVTLADGGNKLWPWLSLALALAWLLTVLGWLWSRRRGRATAAPSQKPRAENQLLAALQKTCEANDAEASKANLLEWAALKWPGSRTRSLGELAAQFDGDLQVQLHQLSQKLYSPGRGAWDGRALWTNFSRREPTPPPKTMQPQLEPLYYQDN